MTLVKLDNGNYINTDMVAEIVQRVDEQGIGLFMANDTDPESYGISITPADRDRIVEAMSPKLPKPYAYESKEGTLLFDAEVAQYNRDYHNSIGIEDGLYTTDQMRQALEVTDDEQ